MPEGKHTRFPDEGIGRYVDEMHKANSSAMLSKEEPTSPSDHASSSQGVKRSRDGSPRVTTHAEAEHVASKAAKAEKTSLGKGEDLLKAEGGESESKNGLEAATLSSAGGRDKDAPTSKPSPIIENGPNFKNSVLDIKGGMTNGKHNRERSLTDTDGGFPHPRPSSAAIKKQKDILRDARKSLPIWSHQADIRWTLRNSNILLLIGETGSGKSTQVPQFLQREPWFKRQLVTVKLESGREDKVAVGGMIAITEPRRVAAISLAHRVADETGSFLGKSKFTEEDIVGYSVRFDTRVPPSTKIKFLTEGMLLQELLQDPYLRRYSAVIIDEIHERSVDVDLLAGFLRNIVLGDKRGRGGVPLKLVIMSATANMEGVRNFFTDLRESQTPIVPSKEHAGSLKNGNAGAVMSLKPDQEPSDGDETSNRRSSVTSYSSWEGISDDSSKDESYHPPFTNSETNKSSYPANSNLDKDAVIVHQIEGRQYPVKVFYTPSPVKDYVEATLKTIFKIHTSEPLPGDILAFLTGQEEIEALQTLVQQYAEKLGKDLPRVEVLPLYGQLSIEDQQKAFAPTGQKKTRKIVLSTNLAETSVTVPGVRFVIDCGKAKVKEYRPRLGLESLLAKPISKSSAIQRKGRAGREAPGKCYRLYTESQYVKLPDTDLPEILRSDVVEAVLTMKARGVDDVLNFPFMDPPQLDSMEKALLHLHFIGALDDDGSLNLTGKKMAKFPLPAAYGRVLVAAAAPEADCLLEAIDAISCLTSDEIFVQPNTDDQREEMEETRSDLRRREGDILTYLTTIQKYAVEHGNRLEWCRKRSINSRSMKHAMNIRRQLRQMCGRSSMLEQSLPDLQQFASMEPDRAEVLLKCFMKGFVMKTASLQADGSYRTTQGKHLIAIHPSSVLHGQKKEAIMFLEHVFTQKNYAKKVSAIQMNWVAEAFEMRPTLS